MRSHSKETSTGDSLPTERMVRRLARCVLPAATVALLLSLAGAPAATAAGESCSNEAIRTSQDANALPGCRAYELVTPANKDSGEPKAVIAGLSESELYSTVGAYAADTGDRMAWTSEYPLPGSSWAGMDYLSTRGANGWSTENTIPPQSVSNGLNCPGLVAPAAYSTDLSRAVLADGFGQFGSGLKSEGLFCGHDEPRLVTSVPEGFQGELERFQNLFLRDNAAGSYQLVDMTPQNTPIPVPTSFGRLGEATVQFAPAAFLAGSNDLGTVVFEEELPLVPGAPSGDDLYSWSRSTGRVSLVSYVEDGTGNPVVGRLAGSTRNTQTDQSKGGEFVPYNIAGSRHAVSGDGSRIFFEAGGALYLREDGTSTVQLDLLRSGGGTSGGGRFMVASEDGSKVFFTDENRLTADAKAEAGKPDLYEYDLDRPLGERLADITAAGWTEPADVLGIAGASSEGSYLYYVADGGHQPADGPSGTLNPSPVAGEPNLYLLHEGRTSFITTLDVENDSCDWASVQCVSLPLFGGLTARVSSNGRFVAFDSDQSLTGYDNVGPTCVRKLGSFGEVEGYSPGPCEEIFLYQAQANRLECVSCNQSGAPPVWPGTIRFPVHASQDDEMRNAHLQRNVSDSGAVFFESKDALVPAATNGKFNVYVYEDGQPRLLSSGTSETDSYFLEASPDGSNVFFATSQALLPGRDTDSVFDIYDARVGGGFPEPASPPAPCEEQASCRGALGPAPSFSTPSSVSLVSSGNVTSASATTPKVKSRVKSAKCKRGYVKRKRKCVRKSNAKAKKSAKGRK